MRLFNYFMKRKNLDSGKKGIQKTPAGMQCASDRHNFIQTGNRGNLPIHRCSKCGLDTDEAMHFGYINKKYFGSTVDGLSYQWDPDTMNREEITGFSASFGNHPVVNARYDGKTIRYKHSINFSRDGWMTFPEGYFDEKTVDLRPEDRKALNDWLASAPFQTFHTSRDTLNNVGCPGYFIAESFSCTFANGRRFRCLAPRNEAFLELCCVIERILGFRSPEIVEQIVEERPRYPTVSGVVVQCCGKQVPWFYAYCPYCGKYISDRSVYCEMHYDNAVTMWMCDECHTGNLLEHRFCGKCGRKWS